jgi:Tfp pilus assembly protein FimT
MKAESRRAFTLIELLVVISIIDTLALQFGFSGGVLIRPRGG